jgi:hypothetical protein
MGKKVRLHRTRAQAIEWSAVASARTADHLRSILVDEDHLAALYGLLPTLGKHHVGTFAGPMAALTGLSRDEWASRVRTALDEHEATDERDRSRRVHLTVPEYTQETRRLQKLIPLGCTMPPDTQAFVTSPDMHEVVLAAALTVAPTDVRTLDPELDPPARSGVLLLPAPLRIGDGTNHARVSLLAWRPTQVRLGTAAVPSLRSEEYSTREDNTDQSLSGPFHGTVRNAKVLGVAVPRLVPIGVTP